MYTVQTVVRFLNQVQLHFFVGGPMPYLCYLCLFAHSGIQHILCFVVCCARVRLVSCVPNVASFCGLSILDCPFCLFSTLWHGWCTLVINLRNTYFGCFILLFGSLLIFDGLFQLVLIFLYNICMDRINETINHDIVYSTCNLWYAERQCYTYFCKWQDETF
jgi:hypothetical protein